MNDKIIESKIRDIPNFPKPGINYKDITPLLMDHSAFNHCIKIFFDRYKDEKLDKVVGIESRGFIFGAPLALKLGCSFVIARKPGKLPSEKISETYELEYRHDSLEIHSESIKIDERVLIVDDVLATGGTAKAACSLVEKLGGKIIEVSFLIVLKNLLGRELLNKFKTYSILEF